MRILDNAQLALVTGGIDGPRFPLPNPAGPQIPSTTQLELQMWWLGLGDDNGYVPPTNP